MSLIPLTAEQRDRVDRVINEGAAIATLTTPEELHYAAYSWNWDDGVAQLREIVLRADCALATASLIFWNGLPDEVIGSYATRDEAEEVDGEGAVFDLQMLICERVSAGAYERHDIAYDPADDGGTNWVEDYPEDAPHALPEALTQAIPGRALDDDIMF
jgi:hypothetical protein